MGTTQVSLAARWRVGMTTLKPNRISFVGVAAGAVVVAVVAGAIALVDNWVPVLSLGVLFVFAVLPIAVFWGTRYAALVAVASMLTFNFFFLPPVYTFNLADGRNWFALAVGAAEQVGLMMAACTSAELVGAVLEELSAQLDHPVDIVLVWASVR